MKTRRKMKTRVSFAVSLLLVSTPALAETLTNRSIIALSASGIGDEAIIAKIQSSEGKFDLSTEQMLALKKKGVSGPVIAAMINAGNHSGQGATTLPRGQSSGSERSGAAAVLAAKRASGIYLMSGGQLVRIDFNVSGQTKTSGMLGTVLTYGIASTSIKTVLQGETARVKTSEHAPTFYFYLTDGTSQANVSSFEAQSSSPVSPNEFSLIRLTPKNGSREARIGKVNIGGAKSGVIDKDRIDFKYDEIRPGVFSVKPGIELASGEYSFVMIGAGGAKLAKYFDFSVQ